MGINSPGQQCGHLHSISSFTVYHSCAASYVVFQIRRPQGRDSGAFCTVPSSGYHSSISAQSRIKFQFLWVLQSDLELTHTAIWLSLSWLQPMILIIPSFHTFEVCGSSPLIAVVSVTTKQFHMTFSYLLAPPSPSGQHQTMPGT